MKEVIVQLYPTQKFIGRIPEFTDLYKSNRKRRGIIKSLYFALRRRLVTIAGRPSLLIVDMNIVLTFPSRISNE